MSYQKGIEQTITFKMVDNIDFATPAPGLTPSVEISKDGGAFSATTNSATAISDGWYKITLTSTEMAAEEIILKATSAGAAQCDRIITTESITSAVTEIKGTGFTESTHSLAERPLGGGGGGGHCSWFDEDLKRANKFFKSFPPKFKEFEAKFTTLQEKAADTETNPATDAQLLSLYELIASMQTTMDAMKAGQATTDRLILEMASEDSLEAILDGLE